jgi:hypothetical protein
MKSPKLTAIPTVFQGCTYRSRLEARWAAAFDALGIAVTYEEEGYQSDSGDNYLPDFAINGSKDVVSIKPLQDAIDHTEAFRRELDWQWCFGKVGRRLWIIAGVPQPNKYRVHPPQSAGGKAYSVFADCRRCQGVCYTETEGREWGTFGPHACRQHDRRPTEADRVHAAMKRAMAERFGERNNALAIEAQIAGVKS